MLQIRWRRWLTGRFLESWLSDRAYYRISLQSSPDGAGLSTDNPDQRIAEDVRAFVGDSFGGTQGVLFFGIDLLSNIVTLCSFVTILWTLSGPLHVWGINIPGYMVWVALLYAVVGSVLTHLIGRKLVPLSFIKQRVEANFRFALVRIRENPEGVALSDGETRELAGLRLRFDALARNWLDLMRRTKYLNALTSGYAQIAGIFPIVVAAPRFFSGQLQLGGLTQISDAFGQVQGALSWLVNNYQDLATFRANIDRLTTFHSAIEAARAASVRQETAVSESGGAFALRDTTITLPNGEALLTDASLILATGPIHRHHRPLRQRQIDLVPRPRRHLAVRHLPRPAPRQHPHVPAAAPLHPARHAAQRAGLSAGAGHLSRRGGAGGADDSGLSHLIAGLDDEDSWLQRLSGGEAQRLAIARALLARPDWLFLDEATANLDPESEASLYVMLKQRLPATTIVSIAHRPAVAAQHDRQLRFERPPGRLVEAPPS